VAARHKGRSEVERVLLARRGREFLVFVDPAGPGDATGSQVMQVMVWRVMWRARLSAPAGCRALGADAAVLAG
jgi:hypothetical protein